MLEAGTSTVVYEAATALTALTSNPVAVVSSIQCTKNLLQAPLLIRPCYQNAAATRLLQICNKEADNNVNPGPCGHHDSFAKLSQVKLIVLDKVETLRRQHGLQDSLTMEVLRILASPDLDVRKKALGIALELVRTARSPAFPRGAS